MNQFKQIERRDNLDKEEFLTQYLKPRRPVVLTDFSRNWPATQKWTFDYFKQAHGHIKVPLVGPNFQKPGSNYMKPEKLMQLGDYIDLLQSGEKTPYRIFLWNILEHVPALKADVSNPDICDGWIDKYPFMFFGGKDAVTNLHYDIDCSHVFHTHFQTRKHIVLFDDQQNRSLYQHPFTVKSMVDPLHPDMDKYPAFQRAVGYETILEHGETLFIPSLWWHHIVYVEPGFSISLRAVDSPVMQAKGLFNLARHFVVDKGMNALLGQHWNHWKETAAVKRAG